MATDAIQTEPQGWRTAPGQPSLPEIHSSLAIPQTANVFRKLFAFAGPGFLIAVGYMDPGNWATDLAGGLEYGYTLLSRHYRFELHGRPAASPRHQAGHGHRA